MKDNRQHPRYAIELDAEVTVAGTAVAGRTHAISRGGFCMLGRQSLPVGASAKVKLALSPAAIPRPAEAPAIWDMPHWSPVKEPCTSMDLKPAHAKGLNVLYADTHVKFSPFTGRPSPKSDFETCLENWWAEHNWEGYFE